MIKPIHVAPYKDIKPGSIIRLNGWGRGFAIAVTGNKFVPLGPSPREANWKAGTIVNGAALEMEWEVYWEPEDES